MVSWFQWSIKSEQNSTVTLHSEPSCGLYRRGNPFHSTGQAAWVLGVSDWLPAVPHIMLLCLSSCHVSHFPQIFPQHSSVGYITWVPLQRLANQRLSTGARAQVFVHFEIHSKCPFHLQSCRRRLSGVGPSRSNQPYMSSLRLRPSDQICIFIKKEERPVRRLPLAGHVMPPTTLPLREKVLTPEPQAK